MEIRSVRARRVVVHHRLMDEEESNGTAVVTNDHSIV
jgi:hypothetical protein